MRVIGEIEHPRLRISLFYWNDKYVLKMEKGNLEQVYKVSILDLPPTAEAENLAFFSKWISPDFLKNIEARFKEMEKEFQELIDS
jgi:hypothetical protein